MYTTTKIIRFTAQSKEERDVRSLTHTWKTGRERSLTHTGKTERDIRSLTHTEKTEHRLLMFH